MPRVSYYDTCTTNHHLSTTLPLPNCLNSQYNSQLGSDKKFPAKNRPRLILGKTGKIIILLFFLNILLLTHIIRASHSKKFSSFIGPVKRQTEQCSELPEGEAPTWQRTASAQLLTCYYPFWWVQGQLCEKNKHQRLTRPASLSVSASVWVTVAQHRGSTAKTLQENLEEETVGGIVWACCTGQDSTSSRPQDLTGDNLTLPCKTIF